jgi:hypothetical protein
MLEVSCQMSYLGSKAASGAYQAIIALMPPHDTYIETHVGSGVYTDRNRSSIVIINSKKLVFRSSIQRKYIEGSLGRDIVFML